MKATSNNHVPLLRYRWLTRFYDSIVRLTVRENTFSLALLRETAIQECLHAVVVQTHSVAVSVADVKHKHKVRLDAAKQFISITSPPF
jgi:hypothetical protein